MQARMYISVNKFVPSLLNYDCTTIKAEVPCVVSQKLCSLSGGLLGAMDSFARGLKNAIELQDQGVMAECVKVGAARSTVCAHVGMLTHMRVCNLANFIHRSAIPATTLAWAP